jgi:hypothetical protein
MASIIWLASYPKSGNTWVRAFLANLLSNARHPVDINSLDRFCRSLTARGYYDDVSGKSSIGADEAETLALRDQVQRVFCAGSQDNVFIKTHSRFGTERGLKLVAPEFTAGAIYVVRNPVDIVVSAASHYGVSIDVMVKCMEDAHFRTQATDFHVMDYIGSWSGHVASWTSSGHPKLHVLRYEDLCTAPDATFLKLAQFLGLNPPLERLQRAIAFSSFEGLAAQERDRGFKERAPHAQSFFRHGKPGAGVGALGAARVAAIEEAHRVQMERFGYLTREETAR